MNKLLKGGLVVVGLFGGVCAAAFAQPSSVTNGASRDKAQVMNRIDGLLAASKTFYLATVDGDQPKLRPLGAHLEMDGKVVFGVGDFKDVYREMVADPKVEIVACKPDGHWMRYTGTAVFENDYKYSEAILDMIPDLKNVYNEQTGNKMMCFHLEDATAVEITVMGPGVDMMD